MARQKTKLRTAAKPQKRPVQHPKKRATRKAPRWWPLAALAVLLLLIPVAGVLMQRGGDEAATDRGTNSGLPDTPDYHSLLVAADDPQALVLGTHDGLYGSSDGGRSWQPTSLSGQDAMNLARAGAEVVWTAGHNVLAKSTDGGETWQDVRPDGLPHLDVHGFAVDPSDPITLWAALAGTGLYRSTDGGASFVLVSREVGAAVMALAVTPEGRVLAGDMRQGLMISDDDGRSWRRSIGTGFMGLAVNPQDPKRIVATGPGVFLSADGGQTWDQVMSLDKGAGPIAWAKSAPETAYAVGFDRTLYKTTDGGKSWRPVVGKA